MYDQQNKKEEENDTSWKINVITFDLCVVTASMAKQKCKTHDNVSTLHTVWEQGAHQIQTIMRQKLINFLNVFFFSSHLSCIVSSALLCNPGQGGISFRKFYAYFRI